MGSIELQGLSFVARQSSPPQKRKPIFSPTEYPDPRDYLKSQILLNVKVFQHESSMFL